MLALIYVRRGLAIPVLVAFFAVLHASSDSSGQEYLAKKAHSGSSILSMSIMDNGRQLMTAGFDGDVAVRDLSEKKLLRKFKIADGGRVGVMSVSPDGGHLFLASARRKGLGYVGYSGWKLFKCDIRSGEAPVVLSSSLSECPVALIGNEQKLVVCTMDALNGFSAMKVPA